MSDSGISMWRSEWGNMRSLQEQLDQQVSAAAGEQRRLSSQLSKVQGDLAARLDRLTRAFDAFVELGSVREDLALHTDARRWRIAARRMVEGTISSGIAPAAGGVAALEDVPDYWLAAAVRSLPDVIESSAHPATLHEAARRDELRTATFAAAVGPIMNHPQLAAEWVERAWAGSPDAPVTVAQRALWLAAVDGVLPAAALDTVTAALRMRMAALSVDQRAALVERLAASPPQPVPTVRPAGSRGSTRTAQPDPATAANTLQAWTTWCASLRAVDSAAGDVVADGASSATDGLLNVVRSLVEEGSVDERPLLDRAEELSAIVNGAAPSVAANWDDVAGTCAELLEADVRTSDQPARARLALSLLTEEIGAAGDVLVARAGAAPSNQASVAVAGRQVAISVEGGDLTQLAAAEAAVAPTPAARITTPILGGAGIVVLVAVILGVAVSGAFFALALLVAVAVGGLWIADRQQLSSARDEAQRQSTALRSRVDAAAQDLQASAAAAHDAAARATALRADLAAALAVARTEP